MNLGASGSVESMPGVVAARMQVPAWPEVLLRPVPLRMPSASVGTPLRLRVMVALTVVLASESDTVTAADGVDAVWSVPVPVLPFLTSRSGVVGLLSAPLRTEAYSDGVPSWSGLGFSVFRSMQRALYCPPLECSGWISQDEPLPTSRRAACPCC